MPNEVIRVFIVDDSTVFRSQIRAALLGQDGIEVVGFATDGQMACEALKTKKVDLITLDLEMPVLDGLGTLAELKKSGNMPYVLVFSSHTKSGAESTLKALTLGASDFLLKPNFDPAEFATPAEMIRSILVPKINQFREKTGSVPTKTTAPYVPEVASSFPRLNWHMFNPKVVVIASSTGGPGALEKLFSVIRAPLNCPILIVQHMPPIFTATLAERLQRVSGLNVSEAKPMQKIEQGQVYVAPGDFHMKIENINGVPTITLNQDPKRNSIRPAADFLFETAAEVYKGSVLGVVLTGMGSDGKDGALAIKRVGGGICIQDKESSVVFGMPGAVFQERAFDKMTDIEGIANCLSELTICSQLKDVA